MGITYWENNSAGVQIWSNKLSYLFAPDVAAFIPSAKFWLFAPVYTLVYWQDISNAVCTGALQGLMPNSTGTPAAVLMAMERGIHRRIFGRIMGRIN